MTRVDELVAKVERVAILVCVALMTLLVGADVVQRTFSRPVGKTGQLVAWIAGAADPERRAFLETTGGDIVFGVLALVFFVLAAHASRGVTSERTKAPPPGFVGSFVLGAGALLLSAAVVKGLLVVFPSSVPGAQKFALGLMLWAGLLGASIATRERRHILLDAVTKKLDDDMKKPFALISGLVTGAFCALIFVLGAMQTAGEITDWATHDGVGMFESLPIPTWTVTISIPVAFFLIGARFIGYGIRDFRHGPPTGGDGGHGVDLEQLEKTTVPIE